MSNLEHPMMKNEARFAIVLVTAPELKTARRLAKSALAARLIACANLVPRIESHYRWQGKLERGSEVLLVLKTTRPRLAALEKLILARHPYDTAEFVVLPVNGGSKRYLDWLEQCCRRDRPASESQASHEPPPHPARGHPLPQRGRGKGEGALRGSGGQNVNLGSEKSHPDAAISHDA